VAAPVHPPGALADKSVVDELATRRGPLQVVVVSPARPVHQGEARFVTVEAEEGQMGVWPRHADIVAALGTGLLRIGTGQGGEERFAVSGGFLEVRGGQVTILVDRAVAAKEADAPKATKDLEDAREALRHPKSDEEFAKLLVARAWAQARLKLAR
jgi:F-type H+-transporting ATPase subunit epsilon